MFSKKEFYAFLIALLVLMFAVGLFRSLESFGIIAASVFFILLINVLAKKITSFYLDSEIQIELWKLQRYGFKRHEHFKRAVPAGMIFPIIFSIITLGNFPWLASLVFDVKPKTYRAAKRHGLYSYSEMTESHIGLIAAAGILANLFFALAGYLIGFSEFARLSIFFAFFNMLPFSDLDGNKIFFGSLIWWSFLAALVLVGLGYAFFLV